MMGVVEVFPEGPPWFAFTLLSFCIQCAELDDERPSHHHPFARAISGVPFDCREHRMPPPSKKPSAILARAKNGGKKGTSQSANIFDKVAGNLCGNGSGGAAGGLS